MNTKTLEAGDRPFGERSAAWAAIALLALATACGGGSGSRDTGSADVSPDVPADVPLDVEGLDLPAVDAPDALDATPDASGCTEGDKACSSAYVAQVCHGDSWVDVDCMAGFGRVCEGGECVEPWQYGSPTFTTCPGVAGGTRSSPAASCRPTCRARRPTARATRHTARS